MSTDLNMEYQEVKFGEIAKHISKRVEPSETTLEIYVGLEHLDPHSLKITRHGVPSDVAGQKLLVKKGQIIFGKRRAYQRKVAVADWDCICSAHAMVLEAIPGKILPEFLPFFMQSNQFMDRAVEISEGSLSPTIKWKILEQQKFKIPSLPLQEKWVIACSKINTVIVSTQSSIESCEKLLACLENSILNEKNNNWIELSFSQLVKKYIDYRGRTPKKLGLDWGAGDIKALSANNVKNGFIDFETECHLGSEDLYKSWMTNGDCSKGDVVMTMEAPLGNVAQIPDDSKYILSQRVILIKPNETVNSDFLYHLMKTSYFQKKMEAMSTGTTAKGIKRASLDKIRVNLPKNIEDQIKISNLFKNIESMISDLKDKKHVLKSIYFQLSNIQ